MKRGEKVITKGGGTGEGGRECDDPPSDVT